MVLHTCFTSVKVHEKKFDKFLKKKWWRRTSRKQIRFFDGQSTTGRNFAPKNEKDSENIYKNEVKIVGFFRKIEISKKSYDPHFIFIYIVRIFLVSLDIIKHICL